jgi:hypothetical protein
MYEGQGFFGVSESTSGQQQSQPFPHFHLVLKPLRMAEERIKRGEL